MQKIKAIRVYGTNNAGKSNVILKSILDLFGEEGTDDVQKLEEKQSVPNQEYKDPNCELLTILNTSFIKEYEDLLFLDYDKIKNHTKCLKFLSKEKERRAVEYRKIFMKDKDKILDATYVVERGGKDILIISGCPSEMNVCLFYIIYIYVFLFEIPISLVVFADRTKLDLLDKLSVTIHEKTIDFEVIANVHIKKETRKDSLTKLKKEINKNIYT